MFLRSLLANLSDGVVACDAEGRVALLNEAAQKLHEFALGTEETADGILPTDWATHYHLYHPDGGTLMQLEEVPLYRALQGESVSGVEVVVKSPSGKMHRLLANGDPIFAPDGQKLGAVVVLHDVTEYQTAETARREVEQRFRGIFDQSYQFIGLLKPDGTLIEANQTALDFAGITTEMVINRPFWEGYWWQISPETQTQLQQAIARAAQGELVSYEVEVWGRNRTVNTIDFSLKPILDESGKVILIIPEGRDITRRVKAETDLQLLNQQLEERVAERTLELLRSHQVKEQALEQLQQALHQAESTRSQMQSYAERLALALDAGKIGTWDWDLKTNRVLWTPYHEIVLGYAPGTPERTYQDWESRVHSEDLPWVAELTQRAIATRETYSCQYRVIWPDGSLHWVDAMGRCYLDEAGEPARMLGTMIDITARKQAEIALAERSAELLRLNTLFTQTFSLLERRNQELDQFAYVTSHDLKAPLRAIANLSEWIEEDLAAQLSDESRYHMKLLRGRVTRMENLINGLLQYSRVGRTEALIRKVDVAELLAEIIDSIAPPDTFEISIQPEMPIFETKEVLLRQVFSNLICNAIQHHHRPEGKINVSVQDQGKRYEFSVTDDGPGIDLAYHQKIFAIFQTLQPRDTQESTGIGLSIVKKIIEAEGGSISLESQEGQGSTFCFTWPKHLE
jgi:hypothetical protein